MSVKHPELVLGAAVLCCAPMIPNLLAGEVAGITAAERFLLALVVCWILGSVLSYVFRTYNAQASRVQLMRIIEVDNEAATPPSSEPDGRE